MCTFANFPIIILLLSRTKFRNICSFFSTDCTIIIYSKYIMSYYYLSTLGTWFVPIMSISALRYNIRIWYALSFKRQIKLIIGIPKNLQIRIKPIIFLYTLLINRLSFSILFLINIVLITMYEVLFKDIYTVAKGKAYKVLITNNCNKLSWTHELRPSFFLT